MLINPPDSNQATLPGSNQVIDQHEFSPPLGLMYLKSYLQSSSDHEIQLLNAQVPNLIEEDHIHRHIDSFRPDVVGITLHTLNLYDTFRTVSIVKEMNPSIHVTLGGPHLMVYPEETLFWPGVDSIVIGEGEITFAEMVNRLALKRDLEGVAGCWFKKDDSLIKNPPRSQTKDLDQYPFPDRSQIDPTQHRVPFDSLSPSAVMVTSRGCPFQCTFCCTMDKHYRERKPQKVVEEMILCKEMGYRSINFYDDNFNLTTKRVTDLCNEIKKQKVGLPWSCRCRVKPVTEEMLSLMAEAGCSRIHFGAESATQDILDKMKKNIKLDDTHRAFILARKFGISTLGYFMIGYPGETRRQAWNTIRLAFKLNPDFAIFFALIPGPATEIYQQALRDPNFGGDYFLQFAKNPWPRMCCHTWETAIKEKELLQICRLAYLGFYFRPRYLIRSMSRIKSLEDFLTKSRVAIKIFFGHYRAVKI